MRQAIRVLLWSLAALFGALVLAVVVLFMRFDADDAKALVVERVQRETGRTLDLPGDVRLSFWPRLGLALGPVSLSEPGRAETFASAQSVHLSLALRPLLSRRFEVGRVEVDGLKARVVRLPDGSISIDDLMAPGGGDGRAGAPASAAFQLEGVAVRDATLTLDDRAGARQLVLSGLLLEVGRLVPGAAAPLKLRGRLQADKPALALGLELSGQLFVDPAQGRYRLDALEIGVDGEAAGRPIVLRSEGQAGFGPDGMKAALKGHLKDAQIDGRFQLGLAQAQGKAAPLQADLEVDKLRAGGMLVEQLKVGARVQGARIALDPLSAQLYGGSTQGTGTIDLRGEQPRFALSQTLSAVEVGPLLKDATGVDRVRGRGDLSLQLETQGAGVDAWRRALSGRAQIVLRDGALRGINVAQVLRQAGAALGRKPSEGGGAQTESTDFTELSASFAISQGVARNDDLSGKSPLLRAAGSGDIDLGAGRIDYLVQATVVATLRGQGGPELDALRGQTVPIRLTGPFDAIRWRIEVETMAKEAVRRKIEGRKEEVQEKVKKELGDQIKGLFGR